MRKINFTLLLSLILSSLSYIQAQSCWAPVGSGVGTTSKYSSATILTAYQGKLITAGNFDTVGGNVPATNIAAWDGSTWSTLGSGIPLVFSPVLAYNQSIGSAAVYNGELYVCGTFQSAGGVPASCVAKWNGSTWSAVGTGIKLTNYNQQIFSMAVYNGALYVAGQFDSAGSIATTNIAKWDGSSWTTVAAGVGNSTSPVIRLEVYNNMLIAGGVFNTASGLSVNNIAAWNGSSWTAVGSGITGGVQALATYQNELYASVSYNDNAGHFTYYITKWNGSSWSNVVGGPGTGTNYYGFQLELFPFNGKLLCSGDFNVNANNFLRNTGIAQWDGTTWSQFAATADSTSGCYPMTVYNAHLYTAGVFRQLSATPALNIAEYTCAASGINDISIGHVSLYPNPNNGLFTISMADVPGQSQITIYDLLGKVVLTKETTKDKVIIDLSGQPAGTYLYRVSGHGVEQISSGTFVVE